MLITIVHPKDRLLPQSDICRQISDEDSVPRMRKELLCNRAGPRSTDSKPIVTETGLC
jgi:hypothetical protein